MNSSQMGGPRCWALHGDVRGCGDYRSPDLARQHDAIVAMNTLMISDPTQACFVADFYHLNPVDFGKLAAASWNGIKCPAVIMKCTQGATYSDPLYAERVGLARTAGLLVAP